MKTKGSKCSDESIAFRRMSLTDKYNSIIEFCEEHNRLPVTYPKPVPEYERVRGQFIINRKSAMMRDELNKIESTSLMMLLAYGKTKLSKLEYLEQILEFITKYNHRPSQNSTDDNERKLAYKLNNAYTAINNDVGFTNAEYAVYIKITELLDALKTESRYDKLTNLLKFCKKHKRSPKQHVKNETERTLANFLYTTKVNASNGILTPDELVLYNRILTYTPKSSGPVPKKVKE